MMIQIQRGTLKIMIRIFFSPVQQYLNGREKIQTFDFSGALNPAPVIPICRPV